MKLRKQYQKLYKGEKRNNLIVNLKSDIIHMSTKWALSFLEAKAKEKKKKTGRRVTRFSKPVKEQILSSLKETHFPPPPKFYQTVPPSSNVEGCKKFSISLLVLPII